MWKVQFKLWPQFKESDIYRHASVLNTLGEEDFGRVSQYLPYAVFFIIGILYCKQRRREEVEQTN